MGSNQQGTDPPLGSSSDYSMPAMGPQTPPIYYQLPQGTSAMYPPPGSSAPYPYPPPMMAPYPSTPYPSQAGAMGPQTPVYYHPQQGTSTVMYLPPGSSAPFPYPAYPYPYPMMAPYPGAYPPALNHPEPVANQQSQQPPPPKKGMLTKFMQGAVATKFVVQALVLLTGDQVMEDFGDADGSDQVE